MKRKPTRTRHETGCANRVDFTNSGRIIYLRVVGLGNANLAVQMKELCEIYIVKGSRHVVVDLSRCTGLDSTFMGTLLGLGGEIYELASLANEKTNTTQKPPILLVNASELVIKQCSLLGLDSVEEYIFIKPEKVDFPTLSDSILPDSGENKEKRLKAIIKAHENLVKADKRNEEQFGPFLKMLIAELDAQNKSKPDDKNDDLKMK